MYTQNKVSALYSTTAIAVSFLFAFLKNPPMPDFTAAFIITFVSIFVGCLLSLSAGLSKGDSIDIVGFLASISFLTGIFAFMTFLVNEIKITLNPTNVVLFLIIAAAAITRISIDIQRLIACCYRLGKHWNLWR